MHQLQRTIRRKTLSLGVLAVLSLVVLAIGPKQGGLFVTVIVTSVFSVGLLVLAFWPMGSKEQQGHPLHEQERSAPQGGPAAPPPGQAPPPQGFAPPLHGQAPLTQQQQQPGQNPPPPVG